MNLPEHKKTLRARLRARLREVDESAIHEWSQAAAHQLFDTADFQEAKAIMIFLPLRYEVDATPVAIRAWQSEKVVTVPLVSYEQKHMIPVRINSLSEPMDKDAFGVRTPSHAEPYPIELIDLVLTPGLAFDLRGGRLGRGGGFYDRFLARREFKGRSCGLGFSQQVIDVVPRDTYDVALDMLVTDDQAYYFQR